MTRDEAVAVLNEGTGFRATGHSLTDYYIRQLQAAQRDLEKGKTLPRFLILEDQTITLTAAAHTANLPSDFLRPVDAKDAALHYTPTGSNVSTFLQPKRSYKDAVNANQRESNEAVAPTVYIIRKSTIDFITVADTTYSLLWDYYAADDILDTNIENLWLEHASDWLIGEAGERIAMTQGDQRALALFQAQKQKGRAAIFGDDLALEDSNGPLVMGEDL